MISYACDAAGFGLADLLVHASRQRACQLGLRHHPPPGDQGPGCRHHVNAASGIASGAWPSAWTRDQVADGLAPGGNRDSPVVAVMWHVAVRPGRPCAVNHRADTRSRAGPATGFRNIHREFTPVGRGAAATGIRQSGDGQRRASPQADAYGSDVPAEVAMVFDSAISPRANGAASRRHWGYLVGVPAALSL